MKKLDTDVVVIGGGATGVGVLRDLVMRGFRAVLVERGDLGQGTTGRYHGLLHSGGRYVVSDPISARECAEENEVIANLHPDAVENTGGLFVVTPEDDPAFGDKFIKGAHETGVSAVEIEPEEALRQEPRLNPGILRAFKVNDKTIDGWAMLWGAIRSAREYGAKILTYHRVEKIETAYGQVSAVRAHGTKTGEDVVINCNFVINAGGPWAGQIAAMAGAHGVDVVPGRGIMIAMNHRLVNQVVNRCIPPSDGDILVPVHTVSIIGTTDVAVDDPDHLEIPRNEVQQMLDAGEVLIPGFRESRAVHAWAGARPLVKDTRVAASDTRHMSRTMSIIDHKQRDDISGLLTIAGGKLTTYRLMAKNVVDVMCRQIDDWRPCRTAEEIMPGTERGDNYKVTHRLEQREKDRFEQQIVCECELMNRKMFVDLLEAQPTATFDDLRRQLRLGMGPCQGGFCSMRAAGITQQIGRGDVEDITGLMRLFLKNRWIGLWPILYGRQVRQTALDDWIFQGIFDIEHVPEVDDSKNKSEAKR
ncbi:MAG TPA: anaerobic glycerol-3-phosphate dehydrogenase subunit A [Actinomyces sp.]|jgi:glycerol-3-phosphate dehydrogenase|nr:anaerobic glycerol-3-phosphate dehydrogenase subunit GlpA [Acidobacteriota bacterium]HHT41590.1 anaerobic glycerol-3-phosphate dehydrogenase subunit A [Actinomyces sp.]